MPPCSRRNACLEFSQSAPAALANSPPERNAAPERTPETSSPTSPTHPAQTILDQRQVHAARSLQAIPERATFLQIAARAIARIPHEHRSMCRSPPLCRTAARSASNTQVSDRRDTAPYTARRELARVRESPAESFRGARSQSLPLAIGAILRRADEHLDKVIMQRVVELSLEGPFELRIVEIAWMQVEVIGMNCNALVLELDDDFDAIALSARRKVQQWMLIQAQLPKHTLETRISSFRHRKDCKGRGRRVAPASRRLSQGRLALARYS